MSEAPTAEVKQGLICQICDTPLVCRWTDTHGVGACLSCGVPYRLLHYENDKRVEKPAQLLLKEKWVPSIRRYWQEVGRNVAPGAFNFPGSNYEVATQEDATAFDGWVEAHRGELPDE